MVHTSAYTSMNALSLSYYGAVLFEFNVRLRNIILRGPIKREMETFAFSGISRKLYKTPRLSILHLELGSNIRIGSASQL